MIEGVLSVGLLLVVITLPIKWAASFADAQNTGLLYCLMSSVLSVVLAGLVYRMVSGGALGFGLACLTMLTTQTTVLQIPLGGVLRFALVAVALEGAVMFAFASFGHYTLQKITG
jgi:hypothetical protein